MSTTINGLRPAISPPYVDSDDLLIIQRAGVSYSANIPYGTGAYDTVRLDGSAMYPDANGNNIFVLNPLTMTQTALSLALSDIYSSFTIPWGIAQGGTGASTQQAAIDNLSGTQTNRYYLRSNGTHVSMSPIQAGDVPTLNQNTTGNAATATLATSATTAANIAGGAANSLPYQTAAGTTAMLSTVNNAYLITDGTGAFSWSTSIPVTQTVTPFTPTDVSGGGLTYTSTAGNAIKIGNTVDFWCTFVMPATGDTHTATIGTLPFTAATITNMIFYATGGSTVGSICGVVSGTSIELRSGANVGTTLTNAAVSGATITLQGCYST